MAKNFDFSSLDSAALAISGLDEDLELTLPHLYNALSLLHQALGEASWVGLYLKKSDRLLLGPFQGTPACEVIPFTKGVVGACYTRNEVVAVPDVSKFPGYICCDAAAKSEICVPLLQQGNVIGVLDIDLPDLHEFEKDEIFYYKTIAEKLAKYL